MLEFKVTTQEDAIEKLICIPFSNLKTPTGSLYSDNLVDYVDAGKSLLS